VATFFSLSVGLECESEKCISITRLLATDQQEWFPSVMLTEYSGMGRLSWESADSIGMVFVVFTIEQWPRSDGDRKETEDIDLSLQASTQGRKQTTTHVTDHLRGRELYHSNTLRSSKPLRFKTAGAWPSFFGQWMSVPKTKPYCLGGTRYAAPDARFLDLQMRA